LKKNGSAGMHQIRTFWDHSLILAIPFSRWGAEPYVIDPFKFPSGILFGAVSESCDQNGRKPNRIHPYYQACLWRQEIERNPGISKAKIAAREGISRALRQIVACGDMESQLRRWQELVRECQILVRI
jgi:hypothetical protein